MAEATTNAAAAAPSKPKSNMMMFVLVGLVLALGGSGGTWFFLAHVKKPQATVEKVEKKEPEYTVHLDSFTVNLADQEETHFLRITMELGLGHAPKGEAKEGAETAGIPIAQTRDTILSVLTACKANELLTTEGKAQLKHNLVAALQEKVPDIDARDVYFTEFLVQR